MLIGVGGVVAMLGSRSGSRPVVVLVVDDEVVVRMSMADLLQDAGFHVVEAHDGIEALAILEIRSDVQALVTDVAMPNMNGITLAKIVHQRWSEIGIVVTSGALPPGIALELPPGARFLRKPYRVQKLLDELETVLPQVAADSAPIALHSIATLHPGNMHGAGGLAQPLSDPEKD
jgi:CheY-like chemotaxis protein